MKHSALPGMQQNKQRVILISARIMNEMYWYYKAVFFKTAQNKTAQITKS